MNVMCVTDPSMLMIKIPASFIQNTRDRTEDVGTRHRSTPAWFTTETQQVLNADNFAGSATKKQ